MTTLTRLARLAGTLAIAVVTASCSTVGPASTPSPTVCDDVSSDAGGCTTERYSYAGTTCDEVAAEWGAFMDRLVLGVVNGPQSVNNEARSSRLRQVIGIAAIDLDQHLESLNTPVNCSIEDVLARGEQAFSDELRAAVGAAMYDGDPAVTYEEWLNDVRSVLGVLEG